MNLLEHGNKAVIHRVLIRSRTSDPAAVQRTVAARLAAAAWDCRLPPQATLCIRKLYDPLPGTCWLSGHTAGPPEQWEQALAANLNRLASGAVRPVRGAVHPSAEAVLFMDPAEMLACLTSDWVAGVAPAHWWWSVVLRGRDIGVYVRQQWVESPQLVPAALELLESSGVAVPFLRQLGDGAAFQVLHNVLRWHGIPPPSLATTSGKRGQVDIIGLEGSEISNGTTPVEPGKSSGEEPFSQTDVTGFPREFEGTSDTSNRVASGEPWPPWVRKSYLDELPVVAGALLGCSLLLRCSPAVARSHAFHARFSAWFQHASAGIEPAPGRNGEVGSSSSAYYLKTLLGAGFAVPENKLMVPDSSPSSPNTRSCEPPTGTHPAEPAGRPGRGFDDVSPEQVNNPGDAPASSETELSPASDSVVRALSPDSPHVDPSPPQLDTGVLPLAIDTSLGGIFFLLNVATLLGYYADFTAPVDTGLELNIWDFLTMMAMEFCGREAFRGDRLEAFLAQLAGRSTSEAAGTHFHPPGESREEWSARACSQIRATLREAFTREDSAEFLCRLPARVVQTLVRIDVYFSLNDHPIEIRMAGLDRDPGWIPAAGRYVSFHFD